MSIQNIQAINQTRDILNSAKSKIEETPENKVNFSEFLMNKLNEVNDKHIDTDKTIEGFIKGDTNITMHELMLKQEELGITTQFMIELRNKGLDIYNEMTRVQL